MDSAPAPSSSEPLPDWPAWYGVAAIGAHDVALANRFREHLGMPPSNSAIVSVAVDGAGEKLAAAGIAAATRAGAARLSFHLYNTEADADRAADALAHSP